MAGAPNSVRSLLVAMPGAPSSFLLLVVMCRYVLTSCDVAISLFRCEHPSFLPQPQQSQQGQHNYAWRQPNKGKIYFRLHTASKLLLFVFAPSLPFSLCFPPVLVLFYVSLRRTIPPKRHDVSGMLHALSPEPLQSFKPTAIRMVPS